jgi:hypothetical protein
VTTFADQAVIAIENVRLFDEVQARTRELSEALEQQTATSEVLQVISSSPGELDSVFQAILENATRICEAKFGTLMLRDKDAFRIVALHGALPPEYIEERRSRPAGTAFSAMVGTCGSIGNRCRVETPSAFTLPCSTNGMTATDNAQMSGICPPRRSLRQTPRRNRARA